MGIAPLLFRVRRICLLITYSRISHPRGWSGLFGPYANYNVFSGDPGAGIVDLGPENVIVK